MTDEDLQLTLAICYELHYRGFDGVDDAWEWDPELLSLLDVPAACLPRVGDSSEIYGETCGLDFLPDGIPVDTQE